jgi:hypothetical protein
MQPKDINETNMSDKRGQEKGLRKGKQRKEMQLEEWREANKGQQCFKRPGMEWMGATQVKERSPKFVTSPLCPMWHPSVCHLVTMRVLAQLV